MTDDLGKRREEIARGEEAKRILESPIFQGAFEVVRARLLDGWKATQPHQVEMREYYWAAQRTLDEIGGVLRNIMKSGDMSLSQVEQVQADLANKAEAFAQSRRRAR